VPSVPATRIRESNRAPIRESGNFVLYWMIGARRLTSNFALDRALEHCRALQKPLLIFEALRCGYQWASDRIHQFVIDGMADNAATANVHSVTYYPYLEPVPGAGKGLLEALAAESCVVVTDEFPCFFLPRMVAAAAKKLTVKLEAVDSNGLVPLRATDQVFPTAYSFRRFLQKNLPAHLAEPPAANPLAKAHVARGAIVPRKIVNRWPQVLFETLQAKSVSLANLPIDHSVLPCATRGGHSAAESELADFLEHKFRDYAEHRNEPERDVTSGLSPYLHFGHISVHEIFRQLVRREKWKPEKISLRTNGSREGWWNMSPTAEGFLDELITWREVGYNFSSHRNDYDKFESLPEWAQKTLKLHARDERARLYVLEQFEKAQTHDPLWNAAQTQLVREGRIHNYLRMLWGKKILEWSKSPQRAAETMIHLNNKYGLDGRNPNSYSGIFWVLGRYDRPWGPERPIFGTIRYMSSENTIRKVSVKKYIQKYSASSSQSVLAF
jgi:deoxyribodipyrimidine photo-lyase